MSELFATLRTAAGALSAFQSALTVTQANVVNASTPGYVVQTQQLEAMTLDPTQGLAGGVRATAVLSARNTYAEQAVQSAVTSLGTWEQQVSVLQPLQTNFDISGQSGIPGALNQLFQSFATWGASPNDSTTRQSVLVAAQSVAQAFQQESAAVTQASTNADTQLRSLVDKINNLAGQLQQDNVQQASNNTPDPALDANVYNTLEQLSEIAPITALKQADGSLTVLLAGQTPLVIGQFQYKLSSGIGVPSNPPPTYPSAPPSAQVFDSAGNDITSQITQGQLGGLLQARNGILAQLQGSSSQQGSLNQLAQTIADRVNALLTSGNIKDADPVAGTPAVPGVPLFTYDPTNPTSIAKTLTVDPNVTADQLAAIDPGPPEVANGIPLKLANLSAPQNPADQINGVSYTEFYGSIAGNLGQAIASAQTNQTTNQSLVTQARNLRQQASGVDLNQEALKVLQFQRSYDAAAKMVTVIDELTQTVVNMIS